MFGSRQEEAQRLHGRLLRPKKDGGQAASTRSSRHLDADYAAHRQRFLAEQGYASLHRNRRPPRARPSADGLRA